MHAVRGHVRTEYPQIRSTRLVRQFAGPMLHLAYRREEEYADLTAIDELVNAADCSAVWLPVNALAVPGSYRQSIWTDVHLAPCATPAEAPPVERTLTVAGTVMAPLVLTVSGVARPRR